jgi:diguanylate cyclase (GGDEF)-like protein
VSDRSVVHALLIDRDRKSCFVMKNLLAESEPGYKRYELECAASLEEGLACLNHEPMDIIFFDVTHQSEEDENLQSLLQLRSQVNGVPIVALITPDQIQSADEIVKKGAESYLLKSELNEFLIRTIHHAIEQSRMKKELTLLTSDLKVANVQLRKFMHSDPLTELFNQRGLEQALIKELEWLKRNSSQQLIALLIDLDHFRDVNHTFGHAVGDTALRELALRIKAALRQHDVVARLGSDEFMVLLPETDMECGLKIAERVRLAIAGVPVLLSSGRAIKVTASVGVIKIPQTICSVDELLSQMHCLLDRSKERGENSIISFTENESYRENHSTEVLGDLMQALCRENCFRALKQPIFRLSDRTQAGFEFLSRSTVPGFEMPDDFFRLSFENHLLTYVDHQCLKACVSTAAQYPAELRRHVNLFPSIILNVPTEHILDIFQESEPLESYCIELSEQQMMSDPAYLIEPLKILRSHGIKIAIDDVGFGRSCLENLIILEPDILKIDRKYISGLKIGTEQEKSLGKILKIATALNTEVVAEGIETVEELNCLQSLGVQWGQGYFLGRPA